MKILSHAGLGDHLIINGMVLAQVAQGKRVEIAIKQTYRESMRFLYRDQPLVAVTEIPSEYDPDRFQEQWAAGDADCLRLGSFSSDWDDLRQRHVWDEVFYLQAQVPLAERWRACRVRRDPERERAFAAAIGRPAGGYQVLHEDRERGYLVDRSLLDPHLPVVEIDRALTGDISGNIFDFLGLFEGARAIHCFPSSFFLLVDHFLPTGRIPLFLHDYARPVPMAALGRPWQVISRKHEAASGARDA